MSDTSLVFDPVRRERLPMPIAARARILAEETALHGVHTTPDELADMIEASFDHLYRLWLSEFANAGAPDAAVAQLLVARVGAVRKLGERIGIARAIRNVFARDGLPTVVEGLLEIDFGTVGDEEHPVSRLVEFRNKFSHGSFTASVVAIETHRVMLESLLERVPGLVSQPVMAALSETEVVAFRGHLERVESLPGAAAEARAPFVLGADGSRLDLYPLWVLGPDEDGAWAMKHPNAQDTTHRIEVFFERESLREYAQRWEDECAGIFDHRPALAARVWRSLDANEAARLRDAVKAAQLVLVEAHPGCGKAAALATILDDAAGRGSPFADVSVVVLEPGGPTQSASTFASFVLRAAERALELPPRSLPAATRKKASKRSQSSPVGLVREAASALVEQGKRVLMLIEDAHVGTHPGWGQTQTIASVVRALADTPVHIVATTHPGALAQPFAHDRKIVLETPATPRVERISSALGPIIRGRSLHARVLERLVAEAGPVDLFALCDALDAEAPSETPVFEPAVERALADLRPVLRTTRSTTTGERTYEVFHRSVAEALMNNGGLP